MASDAVYGAIKTYLSGAWATTTIAWENESFDRPVPAAPWVAVEVSGNLYGQKSIGAGTGQANRWDEEGQLWLHVFVPRGSGSTVARGYAKTLADLFRGTLLMSDRLEFEDASIGMGEPATTDGLWFRVSVNIDWKRVEA